MILRARLLSVVVVLLAGTVGVIGATQTWISVAVADGAAEPLLVPGASAIPVLTPLSLAALALGAALSITGLVLRYVFGGIALAIGAVLGFLSAQTAFATPVSAVASTVTTATGIAGTSAVDELVTSTAVTPWPFVTLAAEIVLVAAGAFILVTARRWRTSAERRYQSGAAHSNAAQRSSSAGSRPHDAIDSWDDLSRGEDPTA